MLTYVKSTWQASYGPSFIVMSETASLFCLDGRHRCFTLTLTHCNSIPRDSWLDLLARRHLITDTLALQLLKINHDDSPQLLLSFDGIFAIDDAVVDGSFRARHESSAYCVHPTTTYTSPDEEYV